MGFRGDAAIVGVADHPAERTYTGPRQFSLEQWAELASRALAETLVANGRRRIEEEFSEGAVVRRYIEFFEKVRR